MVWCTLSTGPVRPMRRGWKVRTYAFTFSTVSLSGSMLMNTGRSCVVACASAAWRAQQHSAHATLHAKAFPKTSTLTHCVHGRRQLLQLLWADVRAVREAKVEQAPGALQVFICKLLPVLVN